MWRGFVCAGLVMSNSLGHHGLWLARILSPWKSPSRNTEVDGHYLLQEIFPTQGSNPHLLHLQVDFFFTTEPPGKPYGEKSEQQKRKV